MPNLSPEHILTLDLKVLIRLIIIVEIRISTCVEFRSACLSYSASLFESLNCYLVKKQDKHRIQSKHLGGGSVGFEPMQKIWKLISTPSSYNVATCGVKRKIFIL